MRLRLLIAAAAVLMLGAARPATIDYRLGVDPVAGAPPVAVVEIRFRGDADGETGLDLPDSFASGTEAWRHISDLTVKGATVTEDRPAHRILRHRPNARLTVRYRVATAYGEDPQGRDGNPYRGAILRPDWAALLGEFVFAGPTGREAEPATFGWGKLPAGWRAASDLEHAALGQPMTVNDVGGSITVAGARLEVAEIPGAAGPIRVAAFRDGPYPPQRLTDSIGRTITAQRAFWNDVRGPYLAAAIPLVRNGTGTSVGGTARSSGFALYATEGAPDAIGWTIAHEHTHTWIPKRLGRLPQTNEPAVYWLSEGFTDFFADRIRLRAGLAAPDVVVAHMGEALTAYDASPVRAAPVSRIVADFWKDPKVQKLPYQRGQLLALKWDEDIRRATAGKADLDDVILRMRDHYQQFPPGQGPDVVTGLVSAAWVVASLDLRPDIAKYADGGAVIELPEEMFDGCLQARVTVAPGFDSGFDAEGSFAGKVARGVRPRGPAWSSGLRNGMRLDSWTYKAGDMTRQIELTVRPANGRGRARKLAFWPYGDVDVRTRRLQLTPGLGETQKAACGRKLGGL